MRGLIKIKYIAAGFLEDAGRLLNEFVEADNFVEFSTFASLWKKHKFSLVFMGRPDDSELTEFTNEAFRIALQFLVTSSFPYQVGSIFLLYGLFRNQISDPPIKIRIELCQWEFIIQVRKEATEKKYKTLHYVIDYLISNALIYVKNLTLRGPVISHAVKVSQTSENVCKLYSSYRNELTEYSTDNNLEELDKLLKQYNETKKDFDCSVKLNRATNSGMYEKLMEQMEIVLRDPRETRVTRRGRRKTSTSIGTRRAELKAASYSRKSADFWGRHVTNDEDDDDSNAVEDFLALLDDDDEPGSKRIRQRRAPRHERKVGRPRKNPLPITSTPREKDPVENIDISHLLKQQEDFFLPPERITKGKFRTVRNPYYKLSPKHNSDDSS